MSSVDRKFSRISDFPEYKIRAGMIQRCTNPSSKAYHRYGGRGITVCDRWLEDFFNFYADMGPRPTDDHTLERIDNDGNYEPSNCKWATWDEQAVNRSNNWTDDEIVSLKAMWDEFVPVEKIGKELGKSVDTIRSQASRLALRRDRSISVLARKFPEFAYLLSEQGEDAFREAVEKEKRDRRAARKAKRLQDRQDVADRDHQISFQGRA